MRIHRLAQSNQNIIDHKFFGFFSKMLTDNRFTWKSVDGVWSYKSIDSGILFFRRFAGYVKTGSISSTIPTYLLLVEIKSPSLSSTTSESATATLYLNVNLSKIMSDLKKIVVWNFEGHPSVENDLRDLLNRVINISSIEFPHNRAQKKAKEMEGKIKEVKRLTRRKMSDSDARSLYIRVQPKKNTIMIGHEILYQVFHIETGVFDEPQLLTNQDENGQDLSASQAKKFFDDFISHSKTLRYVDEKSVEYIPKEVEQHPEFWDFTVNYWKEGQQPISKNPETEVPDNYIYETQEEGLLGSNENRMTKISQNFEGYYAGGVPDYATQFLGTSSVESSQIASMFGKANEAINMVNRFDPSLLLNISFIFNFAKSGAYGVYLSELDRAIKTKALAKKMEQQGYEIKMTGNGLTAYPKKDTQKTPDQIQQDIDRLYADLQSKGGTAIGVNMSAVLSAAKQDAIETKTPDPEAWQWIAILHLGGTIVHEAIHAKGHMDEGPSEQGEASFIQWALPQVNEMYRQSMESQGKGDQFNPLIITGKQRHAKSNSWYKTAQLSYYMPQSYLERPIGSDLSGRHPKDFVSDEGMAPWSMMAQQDQSVPIERRLGRQYMSVLPKDLDQEHDSIEEQLRKYTRKDKKLDPHATIEDLLSEGWDEDRGYTTLEGLLDEKRPKPLLVPLKKNASNTLIKKANQTLNFTPFMAEEIAIDFENYEQHYDDPNDPNIQVEKIVYEKLTSNNFNFTDEELLMIGETLNSISDKDIFTKNKSAQKQLFDVQLQLGMWTPITDEKAKEIVRNSLGVRMRNFPKVNGIRYDYNSDWDNKFHVPDTKPTLVTTTIKPTSASQKLIKTATLFGWMNNLSISDGNTIPGLGDRVMAWDDRDEDFSEEEDWIKQQPRYNPTYDIKGFYYRWIEPRFQPQTFDDMTEDYSNTHPAKRFASIKVDSELANILSILSVAKSKIIKKQIKCTRFIATQDVMPIIERIFSDDTFKIYVFHYGVTDIKEDIYAVWISSPDVSEESIERIEKHFQNKNMEKDVDNILDELFGVSQQKDNSVKNIIEVVRGLCNEYDFKNIYIFGSYPRDVIMKTPAYLIEGLSFGGGWANQAIKLGELVADRLGATNVKINHKNMSLSFSYENISINFGGQFSPYEIKAIMKDQGIEPTPLNIDIYNRDFTINMFAYDIMNDKYLDVSGKANEDIKNKTLRTFFDPDYICQKNPIVILRALKLKIRHNLNMDSLLEKAIRNHSNLIFDGRYSDIELIIARENVRKEGKNEADKLFKEFGMEEINNVK